MPLALSETQLADPANPARPKFQNMFTFPSVSLLGVFINFPGSRLKLSAFYQNRTEPAQPRSHILSFVYAVWVFKARSPPRASLRNCQASTKFGNCCEYALRTCTLSSVQTWVKLFPQGSPNLDRLFRRLATIQKSSASVRSVRSAFLPPAKLRNAVWKGGSEGSKLQPAFLLFRSSYTLTRLNKTVADFNAQLEQLWRCNLHCE